MELLGFYCSPYFLEITKLRGIRLVEAERAFGRPRVVDNIIKMDLKEMSVSVCMWTGYNWLRI